MTRTMPRSMTLEVRAWRLRGLVLLMAGAASSTMAQPTPPETAEAQVERLAPGTLAFTESIAQRLRVPAGFEVKVFASGLKNVRMMDVGADGTVYVTRRAQNDVLALRDTDGDGRADDVRVAFSNLMGVHGVAVHQGALYLISSRTLWRAALPSGTPQALVSNMPDGGQHPNRMVRFGPDGGMYVSVGSSCNDCAEENQLERGTLMRYEADGTQRRVIAKGLRNTIGYDWQPGNAALWGMDHGSDFRGDTVPPEELNLIMEGRNYGWPICWGPRVVDPMTNAKPEMLALQPGQASPSGVPMTRAEYCALTEPSRLTIDAHSAPMAMRFYAGASFPREYRSDAFVALRGSWNRGNAVGYKVVRIVFDANGQPQRVEDFVTGFLDADGTSVYGRPVGIAFATDGALLFSDDTNGAIYRVAPRAVQKR